MADVHHINAHRVVHLPVERPAWADEVEARLRDDRPVHVEIAGEHLTFADHVREALSDPKFTFFLGGYVGVFLTLASAAAWAGLLK